MGEAFRLERLNGSWLHTDRQIAVRPSRMLSTSRSDVDGGGSCWPTSPSAIPPKFAKGVLGKSIEFVHSASGGATLEWPGGTSVRGSDGGLHGAQADFAV